MGESNLLEKIAEKIKHIVYTYIVEPLLLWTTGMKDMDEYWNTVYEWEHQIRRAKRREQKQNATNNTKRT